MLWTPKSGLYNNPDRPTISDMLADDPDLLTDALLLPDPDDEDALAAMIAAELGDMQTIFKTGPAFKAYIPIWCAMHIQSWTAIQAALNAEYEPLQNYSMTEKETPAETTETETPAEITTTITPAETTETETPAETTRTTTPAKTTMTDRPPETTDTGERNDGIWGFDNSTDTPSPADKSDGKTVRTVQTAGTSVLTVQDPETEEIDVDTAGSRAVTVDTAGSEAVTVQTPGSRALTVDHERTLTREGNIGVTTSQQMLESELELRSRWNLLQIYLTDFRRELCVGVW